MPITQAHRTLSVNTVLGEDRLLLRRMHVLERISTPFEYTLTLLSEDLDIAADDLLGTPATVALVCGDGERRYFNGLINRFSQVGFDGSDAVYEARLVPWLWFLSRTADCRIFQAETIPDIVKAIFRELSYTDFDERLSQDYPARDYCVQYRETDLNFVSRLLEQAGIYYFFEHSDGKHTLVLGDGYGAHAPIAGYEQVPYYPPSATGLRERECLWDWQVSKEVRPNAFAQDSFDFEAPRKELLSRRTAPKPAALGDLEIFDFQGDYTEHGVGDSATGVRLEEQQAEQETARATGNARGLACGALFSLSDYRREDQNREYLILGARAVLHSDEFGSGGEPAGPVYQCEIVAVDAQVAYRPARITPKPVVQGPQTAIVVGPAGAEIWTDKFARVKVLFHWDRYAAGDENSSCWIRVAQVWAGKGWGGLMIPRVGQEVIVDFLEGDPDQPIVTGRVYNGECVTPYQLPDAATKTTLKSSTSTGGGGFNELRFEDQAGEEQIFMHAERNHDLRVKQDAFEWIGNERHLIVGSDQFEEVKGDKHLRIGGDQNEKVTGTVSLDAGMDLQQKVGMKHGLDAGMEIHLKAGMNVVIEAGMSVTLKAGGGFIVVGPAGVTISGTPVLINSGGSAGSGSGASPDAPTLPKEADNAGPGQVSEVAARTPPPPPAPPASISVQAITNPKAQTLIAAAAHGTPFCEQCAAAAAQNG